MLLLLLHLVLLLHLALLDVVLLLLVHRQRLLVLVLPFTDTHPRVVGGS